MSSPSMIVMGGSAGSLQAVFNILGSLPRHFSIPVLLILHRGPQGNSPLSDVLSFKTSLIVFEIEEKEIPKGGHLYVCPPDYHVLIENDFSFSLDYSEKVNHSRPSLDVCFSSASEVYQENLTGVILSGASADGVLGMKKIQERGGTTIVQLPEDATVPYMPEQALKTIQPDHVLTALQIGQLLAGLG